jgi:hypothetical protein
MSIPRSDSRSSTLRSDSGYFTYIITARRIISGELLKYRKGLLMTGTYPEPEVAPKDWSDNALWTCGQRSRIDHMPTGTKADTALGGMIEKDNRQTDFQLSRRQKWSRSAGPLQ